MQTTSEQELINYLNHMFTTDGLVLRFDFDIEINIESEIDSVFKLEGFDTMNMNQAKELNREIKNSKEFRVNYETFAKLLSVNGYQIVFSTYCDEEKYVAKTLASLFKLNRNIELDNEFFVEISKKTRVRKKNETK